MMQKIMLIIHLSDTIVNSGIDFDKNRIELIQFNECLKKISVVSKRIKDNTNFNGVFYIMK